MEIEILEGLMESLYLEIQEMILKMLWKKY